MWIYSLRRVLLGSLEAGEKKGEKKLAVKSPEFEFLHVKSRCKCSLAETKFGNDITVMTGHTSSSAWNLCKWPFTYRSIEKISFTKFTPKNCTIGGSFPHCYSVCGGQKNGSVEFILSGDGLILAAYETDNRFSSVYSSSLCCPLSEICILKSQKRVITFCTRCDLRYLLLISLQSWFTRSQS